MAIPSLTLYSNRPRFHFRDSDKSTLATRAGNAAGWKTLWDTKIAPACNSYANQAGGAWVETYNAHIRMLLVAGAGYILDNATWTASAKAALLRLVDAPDNVSPTYTRLRAWTLAIGFDILYDTLSGTETAKVAAELYEQATKLENAPNEQIDGHNAGDNAVRLACAIAGFGEGSHDWAAQRDIALTAWYDDGPKGGRWDTSRYFCSDGGSLKGSWYTYSGIWIEQLCATILANGTTNVDPWTTEASWMGKLWEYLIWTSATGGDRFDYEAHGDTHRTSNPPFRIDLRWVLSNLAGRFPTPSGTEGGKHLRWIWDRFAALDGNYADNLSWPFFAFDLAAVAPVAPESAATPIDTSRLFAPPGVYYYREAGRTSGDHDWDPDASVVFRISARKWYDHGHRHLDGASVNINFKGDRVLLSPAGIYDAYNGIHHINAYQRSWGQSLVPLILDPNQTYDFWGSACVNDGGQHYKKYLGASDPGNVFNMQSDAGGLAWARATFTKVSEDANHAFLVADLREAYRKNFSDTARFPVLKSRFVIIKPTAANGLEYAALLVYVRISKTTQSWRTCIPLHAATAWTTTSYGAHAVGAYGDGKLWVDLRDIGSYTITNATPGTPLDANGYGPDQFKTPWGGTNYKPSRAPGALELPDLKTNSLYVERTLRSTDERYVLLLLPTAAGDSEPVPSRAWVTDGAQPDYYGVTIGSSTYLIHRTEDKFVFGGAPDTTPPAEVSGETATAKDQAALLEWTDPVDADFDKVTIYYRTSAIP